MKKLLVCSFCTLLLTYAFAQTPQRINSGDLITKGNELHNQGKYKEAINLYKQVPRNDTNYVKSLYELALTQMQDSAYNDALKTCEKALLQEDADQEMNLLLAYGSILDDMGNSERALRVYDSALLKYPNANAIWFNKGVTLMRLEKTDDAIKIFQSVLIKDPYYASAHFRLAQCALQQGQIVPAIYSCITYLLTSPAGTHSSNAIKLLDNISKGTEDVMSFVVETKTDATFATTEKILLSKIALDKGYKLQAGIDDPIVRQLQVVFEKVQYQPNSTNFWMQFYVPLFAEIRNKQAFEPMVFYAFSDVNIESVQRYIKKNANQIKTAANLVMDYFNTVRQTREINFSKRGAAPSMYHFSNGLLVGKGPVDAKENMIGQWEFYYPNGNLKSTGQFNQASEKMGTWRYYYNDGKLVGVDNWNNGKQTGEDIIYNRNDVVTVQSHYENNLLQGEKKSFFSLGHLYAHTNYKDGKETGTQVIYHSNGQKKIEASIKDDQYDGPYKSYYKNGQPEAVATYTNGKLNGTYQSFHENGQVSLTATYKDGSLQGQVTAYHANGKIRNTKTFVDNVIHGTETEYSTNGEIKHTIPYVKGKAQGLAEYFDEGKRYSTFEFDKDILRVARYFDKEGKEISKSERQKGMIQLINYNALGMKTSAIQYNDAAEKINADTYYYTSGKIKETNQYKKGKLDGISTGYYANGKKWFDINYKEDEKNGLITYYHMNGTLKSYGWYDNDLLNDDWVIYNEKGNMISRATYLKDDLVGVKETYFPNGKLDDEEVYENGWMKAIHQYDSTGKKIHTSTFKNGTGVIKYLHFNGKTSIEGNYVQGEYNGVFKGYFYDGSLSYSKTYSKGLLQGDYTDYFLGGKIATKGSYKDDNKVGTWKYYAADGTQWKEETFVDGEREGKAYYYFPNGKIEREIEYKEGNLDGTYKRFAEDGQLANVFYYKDDVVTGYSYLDKNSQLLPVKPLAGGNGKVLAYYSNGNVSAEMNYEAGSLVGDYKLYFPNGKLYYSAQEQFSLTHGKTEEYYANGNKKKEFGYFWNNEDGPYKEYHENGKIKEEGYYYNGFLHGTVLLYDATGKQIQTKQYYYGTLLNSSK